MADTSHLRLAAARQKLIEAIEQERRILNAWGKNRSPKDYDFSGHICDLLELWRAEVGPLKAPPEMPGATNYHEAAAALDVFQRAVEKLSDSSPSEPPPAESTLAANTDPKPGYLDLIVNKESGEVRRVSKEHPNGKPKLVRFDTDSAMWHTFLVAYRAGERGATEDEWRDGYPGEWNARRKRKAEVKEKLLGLGIDIPDRSLRLVDLPRLQS
jgi:hypothetical protein